jgi:hypothetical protein
MPKRTASLLTAADIARLRARREKHMNAYTVRPKGRPDRAFERVLSSGSLKNGAIELRFRPGTIPPLPLAQRRELTAALAYEGARWLYSKGILISGINALRATPRYVTAGSGNDKRAVKVLAKVNPRRPR